VNLVRKRKEKGNKTVRNVNNNLKGIGTYSIGRVLPEMRNRNNLRKSSKFLNLMVFIGHNKSVLKYRNVSL
jgi:hypothetical protein